MINLAQLRKNNKICPNFDLEPALTVSTKNLTSSANTGLINNWQSSLIIDPVIIKRLDSTDVFILFGNLTLIDDARVVVGGVSSAALQRVGEFRDVETIANEFILFENKQAELTK